MRKNGTYYLARIAKMGKLDQAGVLEALQKQHPILVGDHNWVVTDYQEYKSDDEVGFIFGVLKKYKPDSTVEIFDERTKTSVDKIEPNLVVASSPFIYIPRFSGFVFMHVWNVIPREIFVERLREIILAYHKHFFVDCKIEFVTNLKAFALRLAELDSVRELSATVTPPNPLFSPLWERLKEYLKERRASQLHHSETAQPGEALNSNIPQLVADIVKHKSKEQYQPERPPALADAAVLMAADGYGHGSVTGMQGTTEIVIRTSETVVALRFPIVPDPKELHARASLLFEKINRDRNLKH